MKKLSVVAVAMLIMSGCVMKSTYRRDVKKAQEAGFADAENQCKKFQDQARVVFQNVGAKFNEQQKTIESQQAEIKKLKDDKIKKPAKLGKVVKTKNAEGGCK